MTHSRDGPHEWGTWREKGWYSGTSIDSEDRLNLSLLGGPMNEAYKIRTLWATQPTASRLMTRDRYRLRLRSRSAALGC
jgi:hypothetical protein